MEVAGKVYPKRVFIKFKAKEQLAIALDLRAGYERFDEDLFSEITTTFFRSPKNQKFAYPCNSREEANEIATIIAARITEIYLQIRERQKNQAVQQLNALL
jgi:hypothetical protein